MSLHQTLFDYDADFDLFNSNDHDNNASWMGAQNIPYDPDAVFDFPVTSNSISGFNATVDNDQSGITAAETPIHGMDEQDNTAGSVPTQDDTSGTVTTNEERSLVLANVHREPDPTDAFIMDVGPGNSYSNASSTFPTTNGNIWQNLSWQPASHVTSLPDRIWATSAPLNNASGNGLTVYPQANVYDFDMLMQGNTHNYTPSGPSVPTPGLPATFNIGTVNNFGNNYFANNYSGNNYFGNVDGNFSFGSDNNNDSTAMGFATYLDTPPTTSPFPPGATAQAAEQVANNARRIQVQLPQTRHGRAPPLARRSRHQPAGAPRPAVPMAPMVPAGSTTMQTPAAPNMPPPKRTPAEIQDELFAAWETPQPHEMGLITDEAQPEQTPTEKKVTLCHQMHFDMQQHKIGTDAWKKLLNRLKRSMGKETRAVSMARVGQYCEVMPYRRNRPGNKLTTAWWAEKGGVRWRQAQPKSEPESPTPNSSMQLGAAASRPAADDRPLCPHMARNEKRPVTNQQESDIPAGSGKRKACDALPQEEPPQKRQACDASQQLTPIQTQPEVAHLLLPKKLPQVFVQKNRSGCEATWLGSAKNGGLAHCEPRLSESLQARIKELGEGTVIIVNRKVYWREKGASTDMWGSCQWFDKLLAGRVEDEDA